MNFFLFITAIGVIILIAVYGRRAFVQYRRDRLIAEPFPGEWEEILFRNVSLYRHIPASLKDQLHANMKIFLGEKHFEGCGGLEMTDEIKITIAAQACMLLLNRKNRNYPGLSTILVYPEAYVAPESIPLDDMIYVEHESVRAGESWVQGTVILAWDHVLRGARNRRDGYNVVLHEFAHQLDHEDGTIDGAPDLGTRSDYERWARVLSRRYEQLQHDVDNRRTPALDEYGATDPAEFFAVATETFFEKPTHLKQHEPDLYEELKNYYKVDPAEWD